MERCAGRSVADGRSCARRWLWLPADVSVASAALFTSSAIVGFNQTADCRAWLQANPQHAPQPAPSRSSLLLVPAPTCPIQGDIPLLCSSGRTGVSR